MKMKCKDYYWFFSKQMPGKWTRDLRTGNIEFKVYFKNLVENSTLNFYIESL